MFPVVDVCIEEGDGGKDSNCLYNPNPNRYSPCSAQKCCPPLRLFLARFFIIPLGFLVVPWFASWSVSVDVDVDCDAKSPCFSQSSSSLPSGKFFPVFLEDLVRDTIFVFVFIAADGVVVVLVLVVIVISPKKNAERQTIIGTRCVDGNHLEAAVVDGFGKRAHENCICCGENPSDLQTLHVPPNQHCIDEEFRVINWFRCELFHLISFFFF